MNTDAEAFDLDWLLAFAVWLLAACGTLGSLFFSEVMGFAPCSLCWWQRIFMYPLVVVVLVGLFPYDGKMVRFALPLAGCGWAVALYHTLLYEGIIPEDAAPCQQGVSCTEEYIELFGFLSIPAMSWVCFTAIVAILLVLRRRLS
jgi:disulfide bond formation protein DsbB